MNVLFMSLSNYQTITFHGIYTDLLRQFVLHGDVVYILSPVERRDSEREHVIEEEHSRIVKIRIWNMQKANILEKGVSMLTIDRLFIRAIKKYFSDVKFDLVLYPTPPITLLKTVKFVKKRDKANTYLLLKDIFPQNAVDIGLMTTTGFKGLLYRHFRKQEKELYRVSDYIGCMSPANVEYVIKHNPEVNPQRVEVCPNTTDPIDMSCSEEERNEIRTKYGLPLDKKIFIYGGNLGKPQDIPFIIECLKSCKDIGDACFLIVGNGTEYGKLERYAITEKQSNFVLIRKLPRDEYDMLVAACDVGLIFLDYRFTIPNFPSRLLGYMQAKLPVLAVTDSSTDIGKVIDDGNFGWGIKSNSKKQFRKAIEGCISANLTYFGQNAYKYLINHYSSKKQYYTIMRHFEGNEETINN